MCSILKKFLIISFIFVYPGNILYASFDSDTFKSLSRIQINESGPLTELSTDDAKVLYDSGDADTVFLTILSQTVPESYMNIAKHVFISDYHREDGKDVYYTEDEILREIQGNYKEIRSLLSTVINNANYRKGLEKDVSFFINSKYLANTWLRKKFGEKASFNNLSIEEDTFTKLKPSIIEYKEEDFCQREFFGENYAILVCALQGYIIDYLSKPNDIGKASEKVIDEGVEKAEKAIKGVEKAIEKGLKKLFKF